jgi:parallel beta-helix repeat protein
MKKKVIGIFVSMLLFFAILPVSGNILKYEKEIPISFGNILYVGGNGPGNFTYIQDAIQNSSDGDTVFVYDDSSPYCENIRVNKAINLVGEDKYTTELNGHLKGYVVYIVSDGASICGFTIMHSEDAWRYAGIEIYEADNVTVSDNIIMENCIGVSVRGEHQFNSYAVNNKISDNIISSNSRFGIWLDLCNDSIITNNIITDTEERGIHTNFACHNTISDNYISNNNIGMSLYQFSNNNKIIGNKITDNRMWGLFIDESSSFIVSNNNISNNKLRGVWLRNANNHNITGNAITNNKICGLALDGSYRNNICQNNFIDNGVINVRFALYFTKIFERNKWDGNYWGESKTRIHLIHGRISIFGFIFGILPWINFDWHPASEPYDV